MKQTVFTTTNTGREILVQLYLKDRTDLFEITLRATRAEEDTVREVEVPIMVERAGNKKPEYKHPNGRVIIETTAYISGYDYPFPITISPQIDSASITGAELIVSPKLGELIHLAKLAR